jgi:hypothetical protein
VHDRISDVSGSTSIVVPALGRFRVVRVVPE